jgi:2-iminoacetate synthase
MPLTESAPTIDHSLIDATLAQVSTHDPQRIREILAKARELKGLSFDDLPPLMAMRDPDLLEELFDTARQVKQQIYGNRMVLFAPLYISNLCANECLYCAFRASNTGLHRRMLTQDEIAAEVGALVDEGHKRLLVVAGETHRAADFEHTLEAIQTVYATAHGKANIRRVNVNLAPMSVPDFRRLKAANIGTFQLFQETYHRPTYAQMHIRGRKADYDYRLSAIDRAMTAGIDDCGIGALFGLYDWRFELLAVMAHAAHLEQTFGVGPHTISVPRIEPADGSDLASAPPHAVSDQDFRKIVALLRIAVPYTGIILSTRESAAMRHETFALGVSQISAGSRTSPGGYADAGPDDGAQFSLGDTRSLREVVQDIAGLGYIPSFCTACYRMGRTGADFMDLAKPGDIKTHCEPNGLASFQEYLEDFATPEERAVGENAIAKVLANLDDPQVHERARRMVDAVRKGKRDVYC